MHLFRLLGWSVSSVFPGEDKASLPIDSDYYKFHLSTLVCLLKVLSVMTFNPRKYISLSFLFHNFFFILSNYNSLLFESFRNGSVL